MEKYFCCTTCPLECKLTVTVDERDNSFIAVAGNRGPRGEIFARQELVLPLRVLTTPVRLEGGRGLVRGQFFDGGGRLVASSAQEGLIRLHH